jgi:hypothetical protein
MLELFILDEKLSRLAWFRCNGNDRQKICDELRCVRDWNSRDHPRWLVFETENSLQIRPDQYEIAKHLLDKPNSICQLNMGRGKTRVILPMLILDFAEKDPNIMHKLPRIHVLRSLISEFLDYIQSSLGGGVMRIQILEHPFGRDVQLTPPLIRSMKHQYSAAKRVAAVLVVTKEHRLSAILKYYEMRGKSNEDYSSQLFDFLTASNEMATDIFDESDALLHHKELLVYAIGTPNLLEDAVLRSEVIQAVFQVLKQPSEQLRIMLGDTSFVVRSKVNALGAFQPLSLLPTSANLAGRSALLRGKDISDQLDIFIPAIFDDLVANPPHCFSWLMECENEFLACFKNVSCCPQKAMDDYVSGTDISPIHWKQLCTLRALLAHGLLAHGLELRYRVDYGLDKVHGRVKKMAVPYRAADVPTERSEFSHPDKCLLVTKLSYYYDGLSTEALHDSIKRLLGLGLAAQNFYHDLWFEDIKGEELKAKDDSYAKIDMVSKLDLTNAKQVSFLYATYRSSTIGFGSTILSSRSI